MSNLIERLSSLEHDQWMEWSKNLSKNEKLSSDRLARWERDCWKPYNELSEEMKEHDRVWARKVYSLIEKEIQKLEAELKTAREGLEFYGEYNWKCSVPPFYDQGDFLDEPNDYSDKHGTGLMVFGRKAREILKQLDKTKAKR